MNEDTLATKRRRYQRSLERAVGQIVDALAHRPEVCQAVLFGSFVEGQRDLFTDLDLLVVAESPLDFITRTAEMYQYLHVPVDMDLLVYTPDELARNKDRGFVRRAMEKGEIIYEKRST